MVEIVEIALGALSKVFVLKGETGVVLVDAGNSGQAESILEALAAHAIDPESIKLILITHGHLDHYGCAKTLKARTGAPVAVHAKDAAALRAGTNGAQELKPVSALVKFMARLGMQFPEHSAEAALEPDIVFDAAWRLDDYGVAAEVVLTPGHTAGSVSIVLDDGSAAIVGDLLAGSMLFAERARPPMVAADLTENWASVRTLLAREPRAIYVTHGKNITPQAVENLLRRYS